MPLAIVAQAVQLSAPVVRVSKPGFMFAESINLLGMTLLLVYRSVAVRHNDKAFADVAHILDRATHVETIFDQTIPDDGIMFGEGRWQVHLVHHGQEAEIPDDPRVKGVVDWIRNWEYAIHPTHVPEAMRQRLHALEVAQQ
ncbi:hypothetical protein PBI_STASIA_68 [Mycobacterium phage Stasia]|uniref:Uncharacterized protein n=1 Tax=Mycobacterium phage Stasia TaxID=1897548 RepID=A0A1D8EUI5_9CAUD|nr:hypothetical protein KIY68_gp25 [Mycobacterium phage Stasia]AOT24724.1 hypothetical protein PBI_STASIA_68 [Mycobacterium phage Stasia]